MIYQAEGAAMPNLRPPIPSTRRGLKLLILAVMIGIKGVGYAVGKTSNSTESSLRLITERLPISLSAFGFVMLALCVFAAVTSYSKTGRAVWGYVALICFCVGWSATFAVGVLLFDAPQFAWQGAINALIFAGFLLLCAADPEPQGVDE